LLKILSLFFSENFSLINYFIKISFYLHLNFLDFISNFIIKSSFISLISVTIISKIKPNSNSTHSTKISIEYFLFINLQSIFQINFSTKSILILFNSLSHFYQSKIHQKFLHIILQHFIIIFIKISFSKINKEHYLL
jgi:hypothetical protein